MSPVELRVRERVAWLTLTKRGAAAGEGAVAGALAEAVEELRFDERVAVAVLADAGPGFFFGGAASGATDPEVARAIEAVSAIAPPVIAALRGPIVGDGAALALACDLRLAARGSHFAFPALAAGALPGGGATQRLPRLVGRMRALDLLLTGRRLSAAEAQRIGLTTRLVAPARLDACARALAANLAGKGPIALRLAKEAVLKGLDLTLEQGIRLEQDLYVLLQTTADRAAGVRAFRRRRAPRYRGR